MLLFRPVRQTPAEFLTTIASEGTLPIRWNLTSASPGRNRMIALPVTAQSGVAAI
jgi:hypothetical protein